MSRDHLSTASHRQAVRRAETRTNRLPNGRPAWMTALRRWDDQYAEQDPGNSPEWDAAFNAA